MLPTLHRDGPATVGSVKLRNSFSSIEISTTDSFSHGAMDAFGGLSSEKRARLLERPSVLLIVSHSGTPSDYAEQRSASEGIVSVDRSRQMTEQADSGNRPYAIEFPVLALAAASQTFRTGYDQCPHLAYVPLALGNILPGYAMCVLDWLVRCTRSKTSISFLPDKPEIDGEDKWYWLYSYAVMRALGIGAAEDVSCEHCNHLIRSWHTLLEEQPRRCRKIRLDCQRRSAIPYALRTRISQHLSMTGCKSELLTQPKLLVVWTEHISSDGKR